MHCVRAVIALAIAITFPKMAYAQTNAIHVIISAVGDTTPAIQAPACTPASCQKLVPRYPKSPTYMLGILEYNTVACTENTPGQWAGFPSTTKNNGEISTGFASGPPPPCASSGSWTYAVIYFNWTAHNNHSTPSPSLVDGFPMDQFPATWTDDNTDGFTQSCGCTGPFTYTFNPYVPVMRPSGETTKWQGWSGWFGGGLVGMWEATLKPPTSDKDFDFTGETTRERFSGKRDSCKVKTTNNIPLGNIVSHGKSFPVVDGPPGKYVDGVSTGGDDPQSACSVLCNFVTHPAGCFLTVQQQMSIKSPADMDFVEYPAVNILEATSLGSIINDFLRGTRGKATVTSNRYPISEPRPTPQSHESDLSLSNCTSINIPITPTTSRKFIFPEDCSK